MPLKPKPKKVPMTGAERKRRYDERQKNWNPASPRTRIEFYVSEGQKQDLYNLRMSFGRDDKPCSKAFLLEELIERVTAEVYGDTPETSREIELVDVGNSVWRQLTERLINAGWQCSAPTPQAIHEIREAIQDLLPEIFEDDGA